nr:hypothetical protein Iba_chr01bCG19750 [Ipomoea batatas]
MNSIASCKGLVSSSRYHIYICIHTDHKLVEFWVLGGNISPTETGGALPGLKLLTHRRKTRHHLRRRPNFLAVHVSLQKIGILRMGNNLSLYSFHFTLKPLVMIMRTAPPFSLHYWLISLQVKLAGAGAGGPITRRRKNGAAVQEATSATPLSRGGFFS